MTDPDRTSGKQAKIRTPAVGGREAEHEIEHNIVEALGKGQRERVRKLVAPLHHADVADLLERLSQEDRRTLVRCISDDFHPDVLAELDDTVLEEVVDFFKPKDLAAAVASLDIDDAVDVVEDLEREDRQEILEAIPAGERKLIKEALSFPEDSAGRLMQRQYVAVPGFWSVGETIDFMRRGADYDGEPLPKTFYDVYVVDPAHRPVGAISLARLLRTKRPVAVSKIMEEKIKVVSVTKDQEDVAFLFKQRDLVSAPVVDDAGRLVGTVTIDDVVDVIEEEAEEDLMLLSGIQEGDLYNAAVSTTRLRFSWLLINLGITILASIVIGLFDVVIEQMVALAILMPIVASMGGNSGAQTLTVTVRALATKELTPINTFRQVGKELIVGSFNGVLFAVLVGVVAWLWFGEIGIGMVIGVAMIINMTVAGLAGTVIPLALERAGVDPALASSIFLTAVTDVVGFFSFLGLAAWLLV